MTPCGEEVSKYLVLLSIPGGSPAWLGCFPSAKERDAFLVSGLKGAFLFWQRIVRPGDVPFVDPPPPMPGRDGDGNRVEIDRSYPSLSPSLAALPYENPTEGEIA